MPRGGDPNVKRRHTERQMKGAAEREQRLGEKAAAKALVLVEILKKVLDMYIVNALGY